MKGSHLLHGWPYGSHEQCINPVLQYPFQLDLCRLLLFLKNIVLLVVAVALCLITAPGGCFKESITMSGALIHRLTSTMLFKETAILILLDKRFALIKKRQYEMELCLAHF